MLRIIKQPLSKGFRLGDHLNSQLSKEEWIRFDAAIAFVKQSGVKFIFDALSDFAKSRTVDLSIGVDLRGTSIEGLELLRKAVEPNGEIWIVHSAGASTFHPKMYVFRNDSNAEVVIGSGNLTAGGLYTNFEGSLTASLDLGTDADRTFLTELDTLIGEWRNPATNAAKALDDNLMKALADAGYIAPESSFVSVPETIEGAGRSPKPKGEKAAPIFGAVSIPNPPPSTKVISKPAKETGPSGKKKKATKKTAPSAPSVLVLGGFVMTLQRTDVGVGQTTSGTSRRSPEIFVPLSARDYATDFWGWPDMFTEDPTKPGKWDRRDVQMRLAGKVISVNMMTWPDKHDFRLRSEPLRSAGEIDDILRMEVAGEDKPYDYYVEIIPKGSSDYPYYDSICSNAVRNSKRRFGYY